MQEEQPLAYASRALTHPETPYATIEKEMMNVHWRNGISSFLAILLLSEQTTSHEAITKKPLDKAPRRLQGILLRSLAYDIEVQYIPSHTKHLADMMRRSHLTTDSQDSYSVFKVVNVVQFFPTGQEKLQRF